MKLAPLLSAAWLTVMGLPGAAEVIERQQSVRPLPGALDSVLMVNDNNPELIDDDGILISTFPGGEEASVPVVLNGRFDLFSHHVYAGDAEGNPSSTLWLAVLAAPLGNAPVTLQLISGSTSLSQATESGQTQAPFLPLPSLMPETTDVVAAGPGSRVAGDLLAGRSAAELAKRRWTLAPGSPTQLLLLPIPVAGLDPQAFGKRVHSRQRSTE